MFNIKITISRIIFIALIIFTHKTFAFGNIVSDPVSHSHILESISTLNELKQKAEDQLKQLTNIKEQMSGITDIGAGINFDNPLSQLETLANNPLATMRPSVMELTGADKINYSNRESIEGGIDKIFAPIKDGDDVFKNENLKADYKQVAMKSAIVTSEKILNESKERSERIKKQIAKINQTQSIKESQDLSNLLLAEQLLQGEQIIQLLAESTKFQAAQNYHGVDYNKSPALRKSTEESWKEGAERASKMLAN
jgi:hypothetical protein